MTAFHVAAKELVLVDSSQRIPIDCSVDIDLFLECFDDDMRKHRLQDV
jgi:hypothetical protein